MENKNTAVFGIFRTPSEAEQAVTRLMAAGFNSDDMSVLLPDNQSTRQFAHEKGTKAPEGGAAGATAGGLVGGTLAVLASIGTIAIPGLGALMVAGPLVSALAGIGAGGAVGGLIGALVGMGIPEYKAKRYEGRVKEGGVLLSVHCSTSAHIKRAEDILEAAGAQDVSTTCEASADVPPERRPLAQV